MTFKKRQSLTLAGFMAGPVYADPTMTKATVTVASNQVFTKSLRGPLRMMKRTAKVIKKVNTPSATAPVCKSTFKEGPPILCLYSAGITSIIAIAPPTAPTACSQLNHSSNIPFIIQIGTKLRCNFIARAELSP
ncbi:hypothetical protein CR513_19014, partial [Mucuna pruriens]